MTPIEEIKSKINILDIVSTYVRVERSGNQYKARCPFHNERTPSFYISTERGSYHCFGCQAHGDIFGFVENIEHIPFVEALKTLADRAGVSLSNYDKSKHDKDSRLIEILTLVKAKYIDNLNSNAESKTYMLDRGVTPYSLSLYGVGHARSEWRDVFTYLMMKGFTPEEIVESGLVIKTEDNKYYDRFRGRIMFPIHNISGAVVGFTGRVLPAYDDGKSGKYVNTPETAVYHKSSILYNYDKAKKSMSETRKVVLVEGQMDVIMSTQAGVENVLAVSGTAFTDSHVKMIKRLADEVILSFDNDKAGESAMYRAIQICLAEGLEVSIIDTNLLNKDINLLEKDFSNENEKKNNTNKDAADIVKNNAEDWKMLIDKKVSLFEFLASVANGQLYKENVNARLKFIRENILASLFYISSPMARSHHVKVLATTLGFSEMALNEELNKLQLNQKLIANTSSNFNSNQSQKNKSNKNEISRPINIYENKEVQYIALGRNLKLEIDRDLIGDIAIFPDEIIEGTIMRIQNMNTPDLFIMYKDIENSLKKKIIKSKIDILNEELRMLPSGDTENEARILREIDRLRRGQ